MDQPSDPSPAPLAPRSSGISILAWALAVGCAVVATPLAKAPLPPFTIETAAGVRHPLGAAIVAILLAIAIRNLLPLARLLGTEGTRTLGRTLRLVVAITIPAAIVLGAAELDLRAIVGLSLPALMITVTCIGIGLAGGYVAARMVGLGRRFGVLLGAGTAICGNSAIVAVAPLVRAREDELALAIGVVNLMGLTLMFALPPIGEWLTHSPEVFGIWAGATIHAVPQVAAAGEAHSPEAFAIATLVKLVRVAMLAPLVFVVALLVARHDVAMARTAARIRYHRLVPWFVWGFLAVALASTLGWIPTVDLGAALGFADTEPVSLARLARLASGFLLAVAMAAIGLDMDLKRLLSVGAKGVVAGAIAAAALALGGLLLVLALVGK